MHMRIISRSCSGTEKHVIVLEERRKLFDLLLQTNEKLINSSLAVEIIQL